MLYDMPPLAVGRMAIECWCLYKARNMHADLVDSTKAVVSVHQDHDYSHHPDGTKGIGISIEANRNRDMVGGKKRFFTIKDRTHVLSKTDFRRTRDAWKAWRGLRTTGVLNSTMPLPLKLATKGINEAIDLTRDSLIILRNHILRR